MFHSRLDIYAAVLHKTNHVKELEKLIPVVMATNEGTLESYIAMAYASYSARNWNRATTFSIQAMNMSSDNIEVLILHGNILVDQQKYVEALPHFRQAMHLKPYRFEPHKGLVDCFVGTHKLREALNIASSCYKLLGHTPRVLTVIELSV